jgi:hypothetical protein
MNFSTFVLSRFSFLAANDLITCERTKFDTEETSLKFVLKIMTLVSSANNNGSHIQFILRGRSFIYILRTTQALELINGELHVSMQPSQRKKL